MKAELIINGTRVDLESEFGCAITYAIADIRKPETRNGSFSKTITLPGTKTINALLTAIYDINYDIQTSGVVNFAPDFNPNLKATALVYSDGLLQFSGYMRLLNITRSQADLELKNYSVNISGEVSTLYRVIGDKKLSDLDLSAFNHVYNKANQKATWTNTNYGTGYVYPMINYGGIVPNTWDVNNFYPAVYAKTIVDAIYTDAGWVYDSTIFNSAFFKRLVIPYAGEKFTITAAQASARLFYSSLSANDDDVVVISGSAIATQSISDPPLYDTEVTDPSNQYNPGTGIFTAASAGYYDFLTSGVLSAHANTNVTFAGAPSAVINYYYRKNGGAIQFIGGTGATVGVFTASGNDIYSKSLQAVTGTIYLNAGDTFQIYIEQTINHASGSSGTIRFRLATDAVFFNRIINTQIVDGNNLDMASWLPADVRQADFLTSIYRVMNMYVETDKSQPNKLDVETEPDFYESGTTRDWTLKLDVGRGLTITPMGALDFLRYKVKYSDDTDYWNKFYKDKWKETYGEKNVDVVNDFLKNTYVNEVLFAATPLIGSASHDRIIPEIYTLTNAGVQQPIRSKLRLLYWAGALPTNYTWSYTGQVSGTTSESTYPYAGHLDNPYSPTVDLCFGVPREIYYANPYGPTTYTNNNLYNQYHSVYINEITDRNSKLVSGYFRLRPLDIYNLSFRDTIYIDGQNYRLNKLIDYDPTQQNLTKAELLKIRHSVPFEQTTKQLTFTYGEAIDTTRGDMAPGFGGNVGLGDLSNNSSNIVVGRDNYVSQTARGINVSGNNNTVGNDCLNVSIFNSSGVCVAGGLQNISVMGTNNITITESNVSYVNGRRTSGESIWSALTATQTISAPANYTTTNSITVTLTPSALSTGDRFKFVRIDATNTTTINGGGVNINGSAIYELTSQYQSVTIEYSGTQFYIV